MTNTRKSLSINNFEVSYIELGKKSSKRDIIIIHGAMFNSVSMVDYAKEFNDAHVIIFDLPYHGDIDKSTSIRKLSLDDYSDIIASAIQYLINDGTINQKPSLQGWSLGGTTGLNIALRHKELINDLVLICSGSTWKQLKLPKQYNNTMRSFILLGLILQAKSKKIPYKVALKTFKRRKEFFADYRACNIDTMIAKDFDITDKLNEVQIPVYTVRAEGDSLVVPVNQNVMISTLPYCKDHFITGYGHLMIVENPKLLANTVKNLIK